MTSNTPQMEQKDGRGQARLRSCHRDIIVGLITFLEDSLVLKHKNILGKQNRIYKKNHRGAVGQMEDRFEREGTWVGRDEREREREGGKQGRGLLEADTGKQKEERRQECEHMPQSTNSGNP